MVQFLGSRTASFSRPQTGEMGDPCLFYWVYTQQFGFQCEVSPFRIGSIRSESVGSF